MSTLTLRRSIAVLLAVASLVGAGVAVAQVGSWTAASTSFAQKPPDPAAIVGRLRDEQARAASLTDQLAAVRARADELAAALDAATAKSTADAATAADLARQLAAASSRLERLQAQLAAVVAARATSASAAAPAAATAVPTPTCHDDCGGDD
jgi:septal ring factor EnvC (AmiA/AmiB activator)